MNFKKNPSWNFCTAVTMSEILENKRGRQDAALSSAFYLIDFEMLFIFSFEHEMSNSTALLYVLPLRLLIRRYEKGAACEELPPTIVFVIFQLRDFLYDYLL